MTEKICIAGSKDQMIDVQLRLVRKINQILLLLERYGQIDGEHHKEWVIDQIARIVQGEDYDCWVKLMKSGEDGPDSYSYSIGIAP